MVLFPQQCKQINFELRLLWKYRNNVLTTAVVFDLHGWLCEIWSCCGWHSLRAILDFWTTWSSVILLQECWLEITIGNCCIWETGLSDTNTSCCCCCIAMSSSVDCSASIFLSDCGCLVLEDECPSSWKDVPTGMPVDVSGVSIIGTNL